MKLRSSLLVVAAVLLSTTVSYGCPVSEPTTVLDSDLHETLTPIAADAAATLSLNSSDTQVDADATSRLVLVDHEGEGSETQVDADVTSQLVFLDHEGEGSETQVDADVTSQLVLRDHEGEGSETLVDADVISQRALLDHEGEGMSVPDAEEFAITLAELRTSWDFAGMADRSPALASDVVQQSRFPVGAEDEDILSASREGIDAAADVTGSHATLDIDADMALDGYEDR
jgi:hypothetical protein